MSALALLGTSCAAPDSQRSEARRADVVIGSYPFTESRVLSNVYAAALESAGWTAEIEANVSSREIMMPALEQGLIDLVPEYEGTLALFFSSVEADANGKRDVASLLRTRRLEVSAVAPAENRNELVVTKPTADRLSLRTISDLAAVDSLVFGGPQECPSRPLCLIGLKSKYGLEFAQFQPIDTGGPLTLAALRGGEIDVGLLFTTDPALASDEFVVLEDDRDLQPTERVIAVLRSNVAERHGRRLSEAIDAVSERLTTPVLRDLNRQVDVQGIDPRVAASRWIKEIAR